MRSVFLQAPEAPLSPAWSFPLLAPLLCYDWELLAGKVSEKQMSEAHMKRKNYAHQW